MAEKEKAETAEEPAAEKHVKYFTDQFDDEEVLFVFHKHPIVMRKGLVFGMLGPLIGILPAAVNPSAGFGVFFGGLAIGCLLGLLIFFPSWIGWHFSIFIVTDQRFIQISQKGLFHRAVADLGLNQIQSVNYEVSGLQETLLGFGTIKMQTYVGDLTIKDVHHPARIQKQLLSILRAEGVNATANYPASAHPQQATNKINEEAEEA
ncbi:MAG TPA: PH domain-containing protein [Candidatus Saccharimonadia bacterium]|nr:PH domain-containing protein [Candidatus Saccharimonadia bacterium]